ncbi:protein suppressor 2 of zeste [Episyrphus balteatus]|uniref:protein suppressor 2 of zeste n=1 Tax=Episyrphus balteatus TaxID=286459 RepID=UPI002485E29D|nr:protein suppressor 2 of zeste [Episyrphus balteatus]
MLDMIADYHKSNICKREDIKDITSTSVASSPTTSDGITTKNLQLQQQQQSTTSTTMSAPNARPVVTTFTQSTMDKSIVTAVASPATTESGASDVFETTMKPPPPKHHQHQKHLHHHQQQRQKLKVKDFNDVIVCNLCRGYLINATSVDICEHSYCRSCIVKYLETDSNCPNCKPQIRFITLSNLRSDDILRTLVYKLVPGLIQQERERQLHFWKTLDSTSDCDMLMMEDEFIYPAEPISLSLEYHPALLVSCNKSQIPPVRYLQCPAGVTVHHLKRFLCSKYDIDPDNQRVDIDIIYEDEILPEDFSLMDVGYCYNWKRVAPMRFCYRILLHSNIPSPTASATAAASKTVAPLSTTTKVLGENNQNDSGSPEAKRVKKSSPTDSEMMMAPAVPSVKSVRFIEPSSRKVDKNGENNNRQVTYSVYKSKSLDMKDSSGSYVNNNNNNEMEREKNESSGVMKMIIARKQSPKRSSSEESVYNITNDFKSLRSNDMRYSDYAVTSNSTTQLTKTSREDSKPAVSKCDIVVSIPQSQINRSPNSSDESLENLSLAELKTAGKKPSPANSPPKPKNVPKLKIELVNSPKTKITIPKPKSAEVRQEPKKISKRKFSIDEPPMLQEKLDLKTYAKNIGLKPIEMMDKPKDPLELPKTKTSPDASPMSTSSSASSSTSNGTFSFSGKDEYPSFSSSSHKKRKKKHSKEPKDSNGKRRKLHAEISSQPENESLKMKVKITGNHRAHKVESRKSSSSSDDVILTTPPISLKLPPPMPEPTILNGKHHAKKPKLSYSPPTSTTPIASPVPNVMASLNLTNPIRSLEPSKKASPTSHKESESSKKESKSKEMKVKDGKSKDSKTKESKSKDSKSKEGHSKEVSSKEVLSKDVSSKEITSIKDVSAKEVSSKEASFKEVSSKESKSKAPSAPQIMTTVHARIQTKPSPQITSTATIKSPAPISKPLTNIQEMKIPASPPLPPSLFKTTPLTIPTITPTSTKPATPPLKPVPRPSVTTPTPTPTLPVQQALNRSPKLPVTPPTKPQFAMPQAPPKVMPNTHKLSPISSIASSAHKHAAQLKRSQSLDGPHPTALLTKQQKTEQDRLMRKSAYGPMFQHNQRPIKPSNPTTSGSAPIKTQDKPFYTSSIASSYTHEISKRKPLPMLMPPSSISVTKMSESTNGKITHSSSTSAVTITSSQKKPYTTSQSSSPSISHKPALEILRVPHVPTSSTSSPTEQQKPSSVKSSPPKATRPPPPPIPLVKIKKSQSMSTPCVRSPALTVSTKSTTGHSQASPPGLISMRSIIPAIVASKSAATSAENAPKQPEKPSSETNGKSSSKEKLSSASSSSSIKDRRPSSRDNSVEILDLSGKHSNHPKPPTPPTPPAGNSLEAALNKIKQNMTSSTVPDSIAASANKSSKMETSPEDLQNLHLLSESATFREKIAIKTLPKLNEISKVRATQTPVRQQNASVRNIPNPSALAFRNQPQIPMLTSINNKSSSTPTSPGVVSTKPEFKTPTPPNNSPSSSTNPGSPPRLKKNLNIEQVAANLNLRAAAAADKSEAIATATAAGSAVSSVSTTSVTNSSSRQAESFSNNKTAKTTTTPVTSSNVVSSSSSSSSSVSPGLSRESTAAPPSQPKTSFKSISSLVASSSSSSTVSAGTA